MLHTKAEEQFNRAREKSGNIGNKIIDFANIASESLEYSLFGLKASTYLEAAGESFDEYRKLRESGDSEEEAFGIASEKAMIAVLSAKADDYVGKNNPVDDVLYGKGGVTRKVDSNRVESYNGKRLSKKEYARLETAINTDHPNQKGYIMQILDNENGDPAITYDVYVKDDGSLIVFGRCGGTNINERKKYDNANRK